MSNELAKAQMKSIGQALKKWEGSFSKLLPRHINADYMIRVAMSSIRKTPELLKCTEQSLIDSVSQCSILGLVPDGVLGHAYLLPYKNKGRTDVQLIVGYKGYVDLIMRSGHVKSIIARCAYSDELFEVEYGTHENITHIPKQPSERGELTATYAVAKMQNDEYIFVVLYKEDIAKVKAVSKSAHSEYSPWQKWEDRMWEKSAIRRLAQMLPTSHEDHRLMSAVQADDFEHVEDIIDVDTFEEISKEEKRIEIPQEKK